jgi:hypothetical protein
VNNLRVGGTSYSDEGAQLGAYVTLKSSEDGVGMLVFYGDDEVGEDGGVLLFLVFDDVGSVRGRFKCCASELEAFVIVLYVGKECSCRI